jgi:hypothetical protein
MHELATRVELVSRTFNGELGLPLPYAREYVYLQFRHICEVVALGCLELHGDLPQAHTKAARKEWNAEKLMQLLQKHHPHCFPQCVEREQVDGGVRIKANGNPNALTFSEFRRLYAECGEALHRGTIRSIHSSKPLTQDDFRSLVSWQTKIVDLMNEHMIGRVNGSGFYLISLRTDSGFPECSMFTMNGEEGLDVAIHRMEILGDGYQNMTLVGNLKPALAK